MPPRVRSCLMATSHYNEHGWAGVASYRILGDLTLEEINSAIATIDAAHIRADHEFVVKEVARVQIATKTRADSDDDMRARIAIYAEELSELPADAVRSGCRSWARNNVFAPSLAELLAECQRYCADRRLMRAALEHEAWKIRSRDKQKGTTE